MRLDIPDGIEIVAMNSIEAEKIPFEKKPRVKGLVEQWLLSVEGAMRETLYRLMKQG